MRITTKQPHSSRADSPAAVLPTRRLTGLPTYVFAWLDDLKAAARARGASLIDLGIGNPDQPTPPAVVAEIARAYADPSSHGYPPFRGTREFREAAAAFMARRFGATLDAEREVLCLSGAKEGLAQITMAFVDESGGALVPDIYYPVHGRAPGLVGGTVYPVPLRAANGYLPRLDEIPHDAVRGARLLVVNYPHNPTGAVAPLEFFEEAVAFCARHGLVLVSDMAYSEITFDGCNAPSVFQVSGARDVAVELHTLSKSFNMAGSRIGFAVGGAPLIEALYAVRSNMGYGTPAAIQAGAAYALTHAVELTAPIAARYRERRDVVIAGFRELGWAADPPRAAMFVWLPVPAGFTSEAWTEHLIDAAGVVVTPGTAFGPGGQGYFRVSLVAEVPVLREALDRLRRREIRYR